MKDANHWRGVYRDAYRLTQPARDTMDSPAKGERRADFVFDSTGVNSSSKLVNRLQDLLFPEGKNFVELQPGPRFDGATNREEVAETLQDWGAKFHASLWASNFSTEINPYLSDLSIGTGAMLFNEGPDHNPFQFSAEPQFNVGLGEGAWGTISECSREMKLNPVVAKEQWPNGEFDEEDLTKGKQSPDFCKTYVEMTYPDADSMRVLGVDVSAVPTRWLYAVVDVSAEKHVLPKQRIFETANPWIVTRYLKAARETRGRGPVLNAMPDVRTANKVVELILKNASVAIAGLWTAVDDGVFNPNTSKIVPGSMLMVGSNGGPRGPSIAPLAYPGNFDVSQLVLEDLRSHIKRTLFDADLPPSAGPPRTATEFVERLRELFVDIGPAAGRVQKELIEPLVLRGLHILHKKQLITLPDGLRLDGQSISMRIVSPIGQRQNLDDIEKLMRAIELSSFFGPELVALVFVVEEIPRFIAEQLGVPQKLIRKHGDQQELQAKVLQIITAQIQAQQQEGATNGEQPGAAAT